ncbi:ES1 protein homolog, mitochondrial [Nilaparvata lugens]|uniref:ES1 protein homolog, mitochondrial n=1 Tax=Nilaparvata lugens TaxID=108931 RepID=UPI00193DF52E|nr:ES1 protein homolog, mitochondrial [Nilaparvata lugens]
MLKLLRINVHKSTFQMAVCGMASKKSPNVAVILAGSGVNDGSEIHEASAVLTHLSRNGAQFQCFAPDIPQMHVIDHFKGSEDASHQRNVLAEAARIARGNICPLTDLVKNLSKYDAVVLPGGFGVAKNLSDFAGKGPQMSVQKDVEEALNGFHECKKPIGLACISPILAAKLFKGVTITLGKSCGDEWPYKDAIEAAQKMGAKTEEKGVLEVTFDCDHKVFSTPAFMYDGKFHEVDDGIGNMIKELVKSIA